MTGAATLEVGKGFGTWLIPIIIFGVLGSVAFVSLITLVCVYSCRSRRRTTDQDPEMTYETYRTPTISYKDPSHDRPIDPIIGRLIRHSRSLHVVSAYVHILNRRILITTSHATNRSMDVVSDPKSAFRNYAMPLDLHRTRIKRHPHSPLTAVHGHTDKYTLNRFLTQEINIGPKTNHNS